LPDRQIAIDELAIDVGGHAATMPLGPDSSRVAIAEAQRIVTSAETAGIVRLASLGLLVVLLVGLAIFLFRRRASYTPSP